MLSNSDLVSYTTPTDLPDSIEERNSAEPDHVDGEVVAVRLVWL